MHERIIEKMNELLEELETHRKEIVGRIGKKCENATTKQFYEEKEKIDYLLEMDAKVKRYLKGTRLMVKNRWLNRDRNRKD
jgi:hypothetical protein